MRATTAGTIERLTRPLLAVAAILSCGAPAAAQSPSRDAAPSASGIYTCIDEHGRRLTSDRPIPECTAREQRVLNRDGSLRRIVPPTLTADERAEREARERREAEARAAQADAVRRDRNLMARYPNEERHARAREAALEPVRLALASSEKRLQDLAAERKPLDNEAEFYLGRQLPVRLKAQIDANEAAVQAQRATAASQQAELDRINRLYDAELERLRKLWGGAQPGSLPPVSAAGGSSSPAPSSAQSAAR